MGHSPPLLESPHWTPVPAGIRAALCILWQPGPQPATALPGPGSHISPQRLGQSHPANTAVMAGSPHLDRLVNSHSPFSTWFGSPNWHPAANRRHTALLPLALQPSQPHLAPMLLIFHLLPINQWSHMGGSQCIDLQMYFLEITHL